MTVVNRLNFAKDNPRLAQIFEEYRGREIVYYANPGNGGDCVIAAATYQLFKEYGIRYTILDPAKPVRDSTVFLAGGGNLVPLYSGMSAVLKSLVNKGNRIVILPHSIRLGRELFEALTPDDVICCRELETFAHVRGLDLKCEVMLTHDLGLYLDADAIFRGLYEDADIRPEFERLLLEKAKLTPDRVIGKAMSCMRHGVEKTFIPRAPNYDISIVFQVGVKPGLAERGAWMMMEFCRLASQITTNRLHVGIACALVGTPLVLYDNNYGKVSGIYRHSMHGRFANIETRFE